MRDGRSRQTAWLQGNAAKAKFIHVIREYLEMNSIRSRLACCLVLCRTPKIKLFSGCVCVGGGGGGMLDELINRTWITFKSGINGLHEFIERNDGPCSPAKISHDNPLRSNEGVKCFSQVALIPLMKTSSSSYCTNSQVCRGMPYSSSSCLSRMVPFLFSSYRHILQFYSSFLSSRSLTCPRTRPQNFFLLSAMFTCHIVEPARHLGLWQFQDTVINFLICFNFTYFQLTSL